MKVVHVVENLDRGAVENWLVRMLRHAVSSGIALDWTFYCQLQAPGSLEEEVQRLGGKVVHSPVPIGQKLSFARALRNELKQGNYEVLHCHHDLVSALYLLASVGIPFRQRLVHVHNADEAVLTASRIKKLCLREPMRRYCLALADKVVGISNHTLNTFLRGRKRRSCRDLVHYYGIEPGPFLNTNPDRVRFRADLDLLGDSLVVLFAGRLVPEKNPQFVLDVLRVLRQYEPRAVGVFVGSGSEEQALQVRVSELGLDGAVRFLGWRDDVAEIMKCSDLFILPRPEQPMEGFGIAVVEAQLAGLRLLLSKGIPDDPLLPRSCYRRLALAEGAAIWARAAQSLLEKLPPPRQAAASSLAKSPMDMDLALGDLLKVYPQ